MFDFLRNLRKSASQQQQERLNAYLDNALPAAERQQFEQELAQNVALQAELAQIRQLKMAVGQLKRMPAPRNFTLDPARYGRPQRFPAGRVYPGLRLATAMTAFFFVFVLTLTIFELPTANEKAPAPLFSQAADIGTSAQEPAPSIMTERPEVAAPAMAGGLAEETTAEYGYEPTEMPAPIAGSSGGSDLTAGNPASDNVQNDIALPQPTINPNPSPTVTPTINDLTIKPTETLSPNPTPTVIVSMAPPSRAATSGRDTTTIPSTPLNLLAIILGLGFGLLLTTTLLVRRRL